MTEPVARLASSFNLPLVSYAASGTLLSDVVKYSSFFRTITSDAFQSKALTGLCAKRGWQLVGLAGSVDAYGASGMASVREEARVRDVSITCTLAWDTSLGLPTVASAESDRQCLQAARVRIAILFMSESAAASFIYRFRTLGLTSGSVEAEEARRVRFLASDSWAARDTLDWAVKAFGQAWKNEWLDAAIGTVQSPGDLTSFARYFEALKPQSTGNYRFFRNWWQTRFKCRLVDANNGTLACPSSVSERDGSCACLESDRLGPEEINSKVPMVVDAVYVVARALHRLLFDCKAVTRVPGVCTSRTFTLEHLVSTIRWDTSELDSAGAELRFGGGTDREEASYDYLMFSSGAGGNWSRIGGFASKSGTVELETAATAMLDSAGVESRLRPDYISFGHPWAIGLLTVLGVLIASAVFLAGVFWANREAPVIKRSSPIFCIVILLGLVLVWLSMVLWTGQQTVVTCNAKVWLGLIGYSLVMANLLVKTWRIYRIFDTTKLRTRSISNAYLFKGVGGMLVLQLVWLLALTAYDPLQPQIQVIGVPNGIVERGGLLQSLDSSDGLSDEKNPRHTVYAFERCSGTRPAFQSTMLAICISVNALYIVAGSILAYRTRNVLSAFNESRYIAVAMYNLGVCLAILAPIYFTTPVDGPAFVLRAWTIRSLAMALGSIVTAVVLFGSKVWSLYWPGGSTENINAAAGSGNVMAAGKPALKPLPIPKYSSQTHSQSQGGVHSKNHNVSQLSNANNTNASAAKKESASGKQRILKTVAVTTAGQQHRNSYAGPTPKAGASLSTPGMNTQTSLMSVDSTIARIVQGARPMPRIQDHEAENETESETETAAQGQAVTDDEDVGSRDALAHR